MERGRIYGVLGLRRETSAAMGDVDTVWDIVYSAGAGVDSDSTILL